MEEPRCRDLGYVGRSSYGIGPDLCPISVTGVEAEDCAALNLAIARAHTRDSITIGEWSSGARMPPETNGCDPPGLGLDPTPDHSLKCS
jgi:hypothetical protein